MRVLTPSMLFVSLVAVVSCGGGKEATSPSGPATAGTGEKAASHADDEVPPASKAAAAAGTAVALTNTDGSMMLEPVATASYPKGTVKDADCSKGIGYTGTASKDYAELTSKCGAPTGLTEYVKTVTGKFDGSHLRDVYTFKMKGGFCYRFFAVADDSVTGLDVRVQRPEGGLVSMASSKAFVTIMDPDRVWCKTHDREFRLVVETTGGKGNYSFGVWARPKDK
jgi:hypothetical protein